MMEYFLFVVGIFLLLKSADYLIEASSSLANKLGVSTLIIGLTVVSFGTSLPELIVNIIASIQGNYEIAFGNIIGSNIANTLLILGIMALITKVKLKHSTIWKEIPFSFFTVLLLFIFSFGSFINKSKESVLSRFNGIILIFFFFFFLYYIFYLIKKDKVLLLDTNIDPIKKYSNLVIFYMISLSLFGLYLGGRWTIYGAIAIANLFGLSEYIISIIIIAFGTSLPELVTSIVAISKKDVNLAVGNIIGSNIFNILLVLGVSSIINPLIFPDFIRFDLIFLLFITLLLFLFMFIDKKFELNKWQGFILLLLYLIYIFFKLLY
jgi:cation:H+ antiporter